MSSIVMMPLAHAQISPKMLKNMTSYLNDGMSHFSPVIGMAALESGLVSNYRFMTPDIAFENNNQQIRSFRNDKAHTYTIQGEAITDAISHLTNTLFRSPAGALAPQQGDQTVMKFTNIATPAKVAQILTYIHELRKLKAQEQGTASLTGKAKTEAVLLPKKIEALKIQLRSALCDDDEIKKKVKTDVNQLTTAIELAVTQEMDVNPEKRFLYPNHTTEQLILAYFCERFDTQKDVVELLLNLSNEIVSQQKKTEMREHFDYQDGEGQTPSQMNKSDLLTETDLKTIAEKNTYSMDDIYALLHDHLLNGKVIAYDSSNLISNANSKAYDRKTGQQLSFTFPDCSETALRHLMNLILYNPETQQFDLRHIAQHMASYPDNPYFENFLAFYAHQDVTKANHGDFKTRSLWNQVVGDLSADLSDSSLPIRYMKRDLKHGSQYELDSGIMNTLRVFDKIFSLSLNPCTSTDLENKKQWIDASLTKLLTTLNPNHRYVYDLSMLNNDDDRHEVAGVSKIQVQNDQDQELFSFDFYGNPSRHQEIENLRFLMKEEKNKINLYNRHMDKKAPIIAQSIWLTSSDQEIIDVQINTLLYKLLNSKIEDNQSKIDFVISLKSHYNQSNDSLISFLHKNQLKQISANVFKTLSWNDHHVFLKISKVVNEILTMPHLRDGFAVEEIQKLENLNGDHLKESNGLDQFPNLREVDIKRLKSLEKIEFKKDMFFLKTMDSLFSNFEEILGLYHLPNLETLSIRGSSGLKKIKFEDNMNKLTKLVISTTEDLEVNGICRLHNLVELSITSRKNLKFDGCGHFEKPTTLSINGSFEGLFNHESMNNLKKITIHGIIFEDISNINHFTNLERLNVWAKKLNFSQNMSSLTYLEISDHTKEVINLDYLTKLETCVVNNKPLKKAELKDSKISYFNAIEAEFPPTISNVKTLNFPKTTNLKNVEPLERFN